MTLIARENDLIGDDKTPSIDEVRGLIDHMCSTISILKNAQYSHRRLINMHNAYTVYVVMLLNFCTGYRGVKSPLQCIADWDEENELLLISDKDNVDGYMTKLAYVPRLLAQQLHHYSNYRNRMMNEISMIRPNASILDIHRKNIHPSFIKFAECENFDVEKNLSDYSERDYCFPFLFFLGDNFQFKEIRPSVCLDIINCEWLDDNSGRHFFRSGLVRLGCSTEIIDAVMGHWDHGNEPFGPFSCLSPWIFKTKIKPFVDLMVDECGWKVIQI